MQYQKTTNAIAKYFALALATTNAAEITNRPDFLRLFTNAFMSPNLPEWHYKNIGVDVNLNESELANTNADKDFKEAQNVRDKITSYLEPYQK